MLLRPALFHTVRCIPNLSGQVRCLSTDHAVSSSPFASASLRRSWLYVPCASDRKLQKSLQSPSDVIIYDLEDSVPPSESDKVNARRRLREFLSQGPNMSPARVAVRLNDVSTPHFESDVMVAAKLPLLRTLVMPKVHSTADLDRVAEAVYAHAQAGTILDIVASIESARALWHVGDIAAWQPRAVRSDVSLKIRALLFAAEDFCADTAIIRTRSRQELLYARSKIVIAAKAFGLDAIDMVCVNYKDPDYLQDECEDGCRLGFTGKQAIHPNQIETVQQTFVPSKKEILRAARILHAMQRAHSAEIGAVGLDDGKGGCEMIDAPMLKQAQSTIKVAGAAGLPIPTIE